MSDQVSESVGSVLFTTMGSWGDLFPFIGVAAELQRRGHHVRIGASPAWADIVGEAGLTFVPLGREIGFEEFARHPEIFGRMPFGLRAALQHFLFDQIDELTADLKASMKGVDLVVSHPAHIAAHNVAEHLDVPRVVGTVFPSMIPSAHTVPGGTPFGPWSHMAGRAMNRAAWFNASVSTAILFDRPINRHRRSLGLRPVRAGLLRIPLAAQATVVMASPVVVEPPSDWPTRITTTSFVGWDRAEQQPVTSGVEQFLRAGAPPVLLTRGASGGVTADDFFDHVTREIVDAGARALVITGPAPAPTTRFDPLMVHVAEFAPFSDLAPRCRGAVHHAGIGTTVSTMRAGIPHVAVPNGFDQPITAALIEKLGVGVAVPWRRRHRRIRSAIRRLIDDDAMRARAADLRDHLAGEDGHVNHSFRDRDATPRRSSGDDATAMIEAVVWDLGGVLCRFHPERRVQELARRSEATEQRVHEILTPELFHRLDTADMTGDQLLCVVREQLEWACDAVELGQAWVAAFVPAAPVIALARRVTAPAALLSNNGAPVSEQYVRLLPAVAEAVPTTLFSGVTALAKPDTRAFANACDVLDAEPSHVLLIDDSRENLSAASGAGLRTHHYRSPRLLEALLHSEHLLGKG